LINPGARGIHNETHPGKKESHFNVRGGFRLLGARKGRLRIRTNPDLICAAQEVVHPEREKKNV